MFKDFEVYDVLLSEKIGKEYLPAVEDITRMIVLQVFVQIMMYLRNPSENSLFDVEFIELLLYIVLGICVYWLLFKKLINFK